MQSLISLSGDIHPNPGPPKRPTHHSLLQAIKRAGQIKNVKPQGGTPLEEYLDRQGKQKVTEAMKSSRLRWATYNIGGPAVSWKRWSTILDSLHDLNLDLIALQEVKPAGDIDNITALTTGVMPEYSMWHNAHPEGKKNGVAFLIKNTLTQYVQKCYKDDCGTIYGMTLNMPEGNIEVVNFYGQHKDWERKKQDAFMRGRKPDVWMGDLNDTVWADRPRRPWHEPLNAGDLRDTQAWINPDATDQDMATRGTRRLDAILTTPKAWHTLTPAAITAIAMPTSDHKLVLMCTGHTQSEKTAFMRAPHPTKKWTKRKEQEVIASVKKSSPHVRGRDPVTRATMTMKMIANRVKAAQIVKKPRGKQKEGFDWNEAYDKAEEQAERKMMEAARKRVWRMRRSAVQRDGHFYALTRQWLRGPIQPVVRQPDPERTAEVMQDFSGSPPWDERAFNDVCTQDYAPATWQQAPPTFGEFKKACQGKKKKAVGPDGVPHKILGMCDDQTLTTIYEGVKEVWKTGDIPTEWLRSETVLFYKKGDPARPENYRPIAITNTIYRVIMKLLRKVISRATDGTLAKNQYGGRATFTATEQAMNLQHAAERQHGEGGRPIVVLLDVAKAFPSIPHEAIHKVLQKLACPQPIAAMIRKIYNNTETTCNVAGEDIKYAPKRGVKEGCPCSPLFFLLVYNMLIEHLTKAFPDTFAYVDDVAIVVREERDLTKLTDFLDKWEKILGIRFNANKTEAYRWQTPAELQRYGTTKWTWKGATITCGEPILTYLGHTIACSGYKTRGKKELAARMRAETRIYGDLPLNGFERAQLASDVLMPRWRYRSFLLWDSQWAATVDQIFEDFCLEARGVEKYVGEWIHTAPSRGGLGLASAEWGGMVAWIQRIQQTLRHQGRPLTDQARRGESNRALRAYTQTLEAMGLRAGGDLGKHKTNLKRVTKRNDSLLDSESSDDGKENQAIIPRERLTTTKLVEGTDAQKPNGGWPGMRWVEEGTRTSDTWYTDGSLRDGRAGTGVRCGDLIIKLRTPGPQTIYRAEFVGILIAATLAKEGDEICLDNQSAAGASYTDPHSEATDHDIHTKVAALVIAKNLRVRWIRSHRDPSKATSYEDYLDRVGNQIADTLANEGGARLLQREKTEGHDGDITADGIMMPSPARKWLLAMRPQPEVSCHWTSWKPLRGMSRSWWAPWLWGTIRWGDDYGAPWDKQEMPCPRCKGAHGASPQRCIEKCPAEGDFWKHWTEAWGADTPEAGRWLQKASEQEKRDASKLRIPKTLWEALEPRDMRRAKVSMWQFRIAQKLKKWTGERAAGKEPIKSAKRTAHLTPPPTTNAPPQPMTAKNVYDQVRGIVKATQPKQKQLETKPTIDDIRKDLENGTREAKAWATKAMIQHYPEEYVRIHRKREREAQAEDATRTAMSKWDEWTRTMDSALQHHEIVVEVQGTLLIAMTAEHLSKARRTATNEAAHMIAQRINAGWACETEIRRIRKECRDQAKAIGLKQAEQEDRLRIQQVQAQRRTKLDTLAEQNRKHAQGRLMIRRRSEHMERRTHPETSTTEWEVPMDPNTTATSEWWVAGEG